jgi:Lysylphosphatidylglycerol synthase TM region
VQRKIWRVLQVVVGLVVVGLAVRSVALNWQSLRTQHIEWRFAPAWIAASVLLVFSTYAVLIEAWRRVVVSMGEQLPFLAAVRIWFLASFGKYVPGKVWALAGAAVLAQRAGVDPSAAVAGALVLQVLSLTSGAAVVALTAPEVFGSVGQGSQPLLALVILLSVLGVLALTWQPVLDWISGLLPSSWPKLRAISPIVLGGAFMANVVAWCTYGLALLLLTRGILPVVDLSLPQAIGVFTCSYIVGFLALFAPGGLGPRESVFLLMLSGQIGLKAAAALAVASRLLLTATELIPAISLLLLTRRPATPASVRGG